MSNKAKKRLPLGVGAFAAALSLTALAGAPAYASQSGESDTWSIEAVVGRQVHSQFGMDQTRDSNGNIADVWVDDSYHLVASVNNGPSSTWTNSSTVRAPAVISTPWGFRVFHTGIDSFVYYAGFEVNSDGSLTLGSWQQVPGNARTTLAPSVAALPGADQEQWMLNYTGLDGYVYTQWHQRLSYMSGQGYFNSPSRVPGAQSSAPPHITYTNITENNVYINGGIFVDWTGNNGTLYISEQNHGDSNWNYQGSMQVDTNSAALPSIAFAGNSEHGIVAQSDTNVFTPRATTATFSHTPSSTRIGPPQAESTRRETWGAPVLSPWANTIYLLESDGSSNWWWKRLYSW
ncbi:hypothetical protein ACFVUY_42175 [Kitasatospora sp. NPDC058063]|uniref:hypothetical protein n=1 Tax=unclassified Kitasatospora TaxID=2633591 RepID=UPI0036D8D014